ncbi:M1 family metallopeptidase [Trichothermofontia sichuanensis B231]|uniref:M1 family metallopeptidase n=1 Tax=Trichothermofontia sichuanensis TaxID=3045816 RepID=UPI0022467FB3|nr:M1 family metallopeptidase [Trichothermofontia sichuanensis]UZQ54189.1 M1 family metallopeptidase [Trichothermofontia sichuanensis B231]
MLQSHLYADEDKGGLRAFELPGARPHYTPDRPGQVEHIFLDLAIDIPNQALQGTCSIRLNPIRDGIEHLTLDAVALEIQSVTVTTVAQPQAQACAFDSDGETLTIALPQPTIGGQPLTLAIAYAVEKPRRGLYFIQPTPAYPHKSIQVWTQGEDEDSRYWFPCFDYPGQLATSEIRVRVPQALQAISNGELISTEHCGDDKIYHWHQRQVHPSYLIALAVGDFAIIAEEWQGKPVTYVVEKGREADARRTLGKTPQMLTFFSEFFGYPYPFSKYAQVCVEDFIFGGMENTSTTLLTDRCLLDERATIDNRRSETLVAHELVHQWFGDLLVIKHWSHAWIKEGMASYSEVLWTEQEYGADAAAYYLLQEARSYLNEDRSRYRRPIVTHVYREPIELYDRHLYEKGACVYHMIRGELGDALFKQAIQTFVRDHAHQTVETVDLLRAIDKATGRNLLFLFDQYVFRGGHPDYKVAYSWDGDSQLAKLTITQTQANPNAKGTDKGLFDLKLPIAFGYVEAAKTPPPPQPKKARKGDALQAEPPAPAVTLKTFTIRVHEAEQSFYFPLAAKPQFITIDPGNYHLKTLTLEYPIPELKAQLQFDPDPISRIEAAIALGKKGGLEAVKALITALQQDPFWGVRVEVAAQLGKLKLNQSFEGLVTGLSDPEARVRRAVVEALAEYKTQASYQALVPLVETGDPSYYVEAAACRAIASIVAAQINDVPKEDEVIDRLKRVLQERAGWNEVVRSGAIAGLSALKTSVAALDLVLEYTELGVPQPLRLAAIRALGPISTGQTSAQVDRILTRLEGLAYEDFFLTQVAVVTALGQMETPKAIALLQRLSAQTADGRVRRLAEEAIPKVQKSVGTDRTLEQIRQELEQMKQENQDLKSRLALLESTKDAAQKNGQTPAGEGKAAAAHSVSTRKSKVARKKH